MRSIIEDEKLRQAILQFTVNLAGLFLLFVIYLNFVLLQPYIRPLFWAIVFSVPLHSMKQRVVHYILDTVDQEGLSIIHAFWLGVKITAQLCLAELWSVLAWLISTYLSHVRSFSSPKSSDHLPQAHSDLSKPNATTTKSSTTTTSTTSSTNSSIPTSPINKELRQSSSSSINQFFTQGVSGLIRRSQSLKSISIPTSMADIYVGWLLRATTLYLIYNGYKEIGFDRMFLLFLFFLSLMALHLFYHVCRRLYWFYLHQHTSYSYALLTSRFPLLENFQYSCKYFVKKTGMKWMRSKYKSGKSNAKEAFVRNANSFASLFVLVSVLIVGFLCTAFLIFKMIQETNQLMDSLLSLLDKYLPDDVKQRWDNMLSKTYDMGMSWLEQKVNETWPGVNVTVLITHFYVPMEPALISKPSTGPMFQAMPYMSKIIAQFYAGNLSLSMYDSAFWIALGDEFKNATMQVLPTFMSNWTSMSTYLASTFTETFAFMFSLFVSFLSSCLSFFHTILQCTVFLVFLHILVSQNSSVTQWIAKLLMLMDPEQSITHSLEGNINAVLICTMKMTAFHSILTWLTFSIFDVPLVWLNLYSLFAMDVFFRISLLRSS
ncbi:hypothetical protein HMI55_000845 [Coelomomyces lativittatus]|nr:hypothetical protein HMI55_000845 [Coelomomyces lativittatus]